MANEVVVSVAEEMNPTRRPTMEDVQVVHPPDSWGCPNAHASYVGVYDGHGGRDIVDFLEERLSENVAQEWAALLQERQMTEEGQIVRKALERAFLLTDIESRVDGHSTSGATVACCVIVPKFRGDQVTSIEIHAANAGDARAVLSSSNAASGGPIRITRDHKSNDPAEVQRVETSGGQVVKGRVLGVLAVARSLGDHDLKQFVIARPYLSTTAVPLTNDETNITSNITPKNTSDINHNITSKNLIKPPYTNGQFLIVACDGLWDVMEDHEAVTLVQSYIQDSELPQIRQSKERVASFLVDEALKRGSMDNVTVVVYWL